MKNRFSIGFVGLLAVSLQAIDQSAPQQYDTQLVNTPWVHIELDAAAIRKKVTTELLHELQQECTRQNISCGACGIVKKLQEELQTTTVESKLQDAQVIQQGEALYQEIEPVISAVIITALAGQMSLENQELLFDLFEQKIQKQFPDVKFSLDLQAFCKKNKNLSEQKYKDSFYSIVYVINKYAQYYQRAINQLCEEINNQQK